MGPIISWAERCEHDRSGEAKGSGIELDTELYTKS